MKRGMMCFFAVAGSAMLLSAALATPGKIVRIERSTLQSAEAIRICNYQRNRTGAAITCIGKNEYKNGDEFDVIAEDGSYARAIVTTVKPSQVDTCKLGYAVDLEARVVEETKPVSSKTGGFTRMFAVRGVDITPGLSKIIANHKSVNPPGNGRDNVFVGLDASGDDKADVLATLADCAAAKRSAPWVPSGRAVVSYCIDYWTRGESDWKKSSSDVFHYCQ